MQYFPSITFYRYYLQTISFIVKLKITPFRYIHTHDLHAQTKQNEKGGKNQKQTKKKERERGGERERKNLAHAYVHETRFERRYSISGETKRPLVDVSDQSTVEQLWRNYHPIENAFNTETRSIRQSRCCVFVPATFTGGHRCVPTRTTRNAFARRRRRHFQRNGPL